MAGSDRPRGRLVPDWEKYVALGAKQDHIMVKKLGAGDMLIIESANHRYTFRLIDPEASRAELTSDHPKYPGPYVGCIVGALISPWGTSVMTGRVSLGLGTAFTSLDLDPGVPRELRISAAEAVYLNGVKVLPFEPPDGEAN